MNFNDYRMCVGWMEARRDEAARSAMHTKLRQQYGRPARGWVLVRTCQALCGLGRAMVATGEWLQQYAMPQAVTMERNPS